MFGEAGAVTVRIAGTGSCLPEHVISTEFIGSLVERYAPEKGAAWAREKLGIRERRFASPLDPLSGYPTSPAEELDLAAEAARRALKSAGLRAEQLSGIWFVSCTQAETHRHFSRMALELHGRLGLQPEAFALEMDAGCGGAVHAMATAAAQMRGAELHAVLLVAANAPSQFFRDWERYAESGSWLSMYLFGDGAGAVVLERSEAEAPGIGILAAYTATDPANPLMQFSPPRDGGDPVYLIDGRAVALGFRGYARAALEALRCRHPFEFRDIRRFYFHQVNGVVLRNFISEIGIQEDQVPMHVERYGNLASAATLVLLDEDLRSGMISKGDLCVLCAVGAGAQYGAILLRV